MTAGQKLARWRKAHDLTQREAADKAGISQAAWQAVESDRCKRIGLRVATSIVAVTGGEVSVADLTPRRRPSHPPKAA